MRRNRFAVTALALFVLGGCASDPGSKPAPVPAATSVPATTAAPPTTTSKPAVDPKHIKAKDAFGDFGTLDPCGLIPVLDLPNHASSFGTDDLDNCTLTGLEVGGTPVSARLGVLETYRSAVAGKPVKRTSSGPGGVRFAITDDDQYVCRLLVRFADDISISVNVQAGEKSPKSSMCGLAGDLAHRVVDTVVKHPPPHRTFPAKSFGTLKACDVLSWPVVRSVPRLSRTPSPAYLAGHQCFYNQGDELSVGLVFGLVPTEPELDKDDSRTKIAGRASIVSADPFGAGSAEESAYCLVTTSHVAATYISGSEVDEQAEVFVLDATGTTRPCTTAKAIAAKVWPHLPKA